MRRGEDKETGNENVNGEGDKTRTKNPTPGLESGTLDSETSESGPQNPRNQTSDAEIDDLKTKYEHLLEIQRRERESLLFSMQAAKRGQKGEGKNLPEVNASFSGIVDANNVNSLLRRELKVSGYIGEQGRPDQISFVSLSRQIETAVDKGYTQKEVVDAVIKAMRPGLQLRSYIETLNDLTLPHLRQILRSHYREKSGTQLYQELATICQGPKESPDSFLLRALDLRQKVLFASKEADANLKYDPQLVQGMFLRSMETGLRDDNSLTKIRSVLHIPKISDEDLIQQMGNISSAEAERQARIGKRIKDVQASAVSTDDTKDKRGEIAQQKKVDKSSEDRILESMGVMQAQIQSLQNEVKTQKLEKSNNNKPSYHLGRPNRNPRSEKETNRACPSCHKKERPSVFIPHHSFDEF